MDILIVKLSALGDVLRTTSLLKPLHRRYPGCRIAWATAAGAKALIEGNPWIERVLSFEEAAEDGLNGKFDLVLSLEESDAAAALARAACRGELVGVVPGLGYTPSSAPYYDMSLLHKDLDGGHSAADRLKSRNLASYAKLWLDILGLPLPDSAADSRPILVLRDEDRRAARDLAARHGLAAGAAPIGINTGSGRRWPSKQLSCERTAALAEALHRRFKRPILLLGGPDEEGRNREIMERSPAALIDAGTGHGVRAFAAIVESCGLIVTSDTLCFHAATALERPVIVFTGPSSASELDAFGLGRKLSPDPACSCFYRPRCGRAKPCLEDMPVEDFLSAAEALLGAGMGVPVQ
ncbi:MAG: glycosyltransferase family 9 protein [Elusimicrobia bacterium]|nr:glycosyltransferase family 9 protein [Elusimicrobiota bacterium]